MKKHFFQFLILFVFTSFALTSDTTYLDDFREFWEDVNENYAYFDKKETDWNLVKEYYSPLALKAKSRDELINILENASEELYDNHFNLNVNLKSSARMVPSGLDLWAEIKNGKVIITEVRPGLSAANSGIRPGMEISRINNFPVDEAVKKRVGKCIKNINDEVKNFFLRQLLAGTYISGRILTLKEGETEKEFRPDEVSGNLVDGVVYDSLISIKMLPGGIGYVRINNSLGNNDLIKVFDSVIDRFLKTDALIIDLRETPGGGNSTVARAIMSRFIEMEMPYQMHLLPNEEKQFGVRRSWLELVTPRPPIYNKDLLVLVGHFTGSMGEGLAIGFHGMKRATVIGTAMAGLNGSIESFTTSNHKIPFSFPTEKLFHIDGTPREEFLPDILIDLTDNSYLNTEDPVLSTALGLLKETTSR